MRVVEQAPLRALNSFGVDARARFLVRANCSDELLAAQDFAAARSLPLVVLGGGSNIVIARDLEVVVLTPDLRGIDVERGGDSIVIEAAAGENWAEFVQRSVDIGACGLENLAAIPGSVGAAPIQNIGAYGVELERFVEQVEILDLRTHEQKHLSRADCEFGYRDSRFKREPNEIVTRLRLRLPTQADLTIDYPGVREELAAMGALPSPRTVHDAITAIRWRKLPRPEVLGNAGSFFKNPILDAAQKDALLGLALAPIYPHASAFKASAAWLIDACGLKGFVLGRAAVHREHALVIVNLGGASGAEILALAAHIQTRVFERFGITLEVEPRVLQ